MSSKIISFLWHITCFIRLSVNLVHYLVAVFADKLSFWVDGQVHRFQGDCAEQYMFGIGQYDSMAHGKADFPMNFHRPCHVVFVFFPVGESARAFAVIIQTKFLTGCFVDNKRPRSCVNKRGAGHLLDFLHGNMTVFGTPKTSFYSPCLCVSVPLCVKKGGNFYSNF